MDNFYNGVGIRIRKLREQNGLTRENLAELADISNKFLYEIEVGQKGFSAATLSRIADGLSVTTDYLLKGKKTCKNLNQLCDVVVELSPQKKQLVFDFINILQE